MERRKHERREPDSYLNVHDRKSGRHIGGLANLSDAGAMFVTRDAVKAGTRMECRLELMHPIMGRNDIYFDAECRWCRKNIKRGWWESGHLLKLSGVDQEMVSYLSLSFTLGTWEIPSNAEVNTVPIENRRNITRYTTREAMPVYELNSFRQIGTLADLSTQGAGLVTPVPIEKGTVLQCRVKLPRPIFRRDYLVIEGVCRWCRRSKTVGTFESGYLLQSVSETDAVLILHLIIHYLEEQSTRQLVRVVR